MHDLIFIAVVCGALALLLIYAVFADVERPRGQTPGDGDPARRAPRER